RQGESCPARDHEFVGIPSPPATILAHQPRGNRQHRPDPGASTYVQGRERGRAQKRKELSHHASDPRDSAKTRIPVEPELWDRNPSRGFADLYWIQLEGGPR